MELHKCFKRGLIASLCFPAVCIADVDEWQKTLLFDPPQALLALEDSGRVTVFDGLSIELVNRALDEQFDRIDNMMFVRIRYATANGVNTEDDGC